MDTSESKGFAGLNCAVSTTKQGYVTLVIRRENTMGQTIKMLSSKRRLAEMEALSKVGYIKMPERLS